MEIIKSQEVHDLLESYPDKPRKRLVELRSLILEVAKTSGVPRLMETTKWGEPSYVAKKGSTIRMDWKPKSPDKYYLFFICNTDLVNTFRFIFGDELTFEGKRAIVLDLNEKLPEKQIIKCLELALNYHSLKHLPHLGA
ncbi:MAG: hypothetical protein CMB80_28850 [Flammeovirgaceae bacterium]|nr:hypothetical protein [Flammeovirgaceae bacterium]MBR10885.1 hypothetical protein [Rickettsiales bacterium]HCX21157.1 hypothetical protein [Cytophagales bacterium]|tara:strand:+ start:148 stop:564 length:417 start_codon:yes stop_codon:yes gene_type:complete